MIIMSYTKQRPEFDSSWIFFIQHLNVVTVRVLTIYSTRNLSCLAFIYLKALNITNMMNGTVDSRQNKASKHL